VYSLGRPDAWNAWWAYLGYLALVGAALYGALRLRFLALARRNAQLEAVVHERTQDLEQAIVWARDAVKEADTLRAASEALSRSLELRELLQVILAELRKVVDYDSASVQILEGKTLRVIAGVGFTNLDEILGLRFDVDDKNAPNGDAIRSRAPRVLASTEAYPAFRASYNAPAPILSWMGVPLISGDRLLGLITLDKREPAVYNDQQARLALSYASQAAISIENARLFEDARGHAAELERHAAALEQVASALTDSEERHRAVLERAHDAFVAMDQDGVISGWNAQAEAIFGWSRSEAMGRTVAETIIPSPHREAHGRGLERFLATGEGPLLDRRLELTALHRDGHVFPVELTISSIPSAAGPSFSAFVRDITERRRAEVRLRAQHAATRVLAEAATLPEAAPRILEAICRSLGWAIGALWSVDLAADYLVCVESWRDPAGRFPEFEAITHRTPFAKGVGLPGRIWASGDSAWIRDVVRDTNFPRAAVAAREGLHGAFGFPVLGRHGAVIGVLEFFSAEIERPDPDLLAMMASVGSQLGQYIERKQAEAAVVAARQAAEQASRAKSAFIASMSHELRTPLNAILGFVQLMERRAGRDAEDKEHLSVINRSGEHLLGLINEVLSIAKIESGQMALNTADFDVGALLKSLEEMFRGRASSKRLAYSVKAGDELPASLRGDAGKLRQILINLVGNAVKFTDAGRVSVTASWRDGRAVFEVEDTGPGMTPEESQRLFAAFSQAEAGRKQQEGTGLGLALSRSYARLMDGDITLLSEPGHGSLFRAEVALPESPAGAAPARGRARRVKSLEAGSRRSSILVVDDDEAGRMLLGRLLGAVGFAIRTADDGEQGVLAWREAQPDLIFMDVNMPVLDGLGATRRIRAEEAATGLARTPVVALSASVFEHERADIREAGCDSFLAKPFREGDLFDLLARMLGVSYVYEDAAARAPVAAKPLTRERLRELPEDWRRRFRDALQLADMAEATRLVAEIEGHESRLASEIAARLRAYRMDELEELLEG
jgi:PAS domain S-box-containing protein